MRHNCYLISILYNFSVYTRMVVWFRECHMTLPSSKRPLNPALLPTFVRHRHALHRSNKMFRLKLIYEESISAFGAVCIQFSARNKSIAIKIINILRY